ncbi:MAG: AAA family ATPase, partial [Ferruginibacter sp.]
MAYCYNTRFCFNNFRYGPLRLQKKNQLKKIVIIGPESTGKSTLCEQLAAHY